MNRHTLRENAYLMIFEYGNGKSTHFLYPHRWVRRGEIQVGNNSAPCFSVVRRAGLILISEKSSAVEPELAVLVLVNSRLLKSDFEAGIGKWYRLTERIPALSAIVRGNNNYIFFGFRRKRHKYSAAFLKKYAVIYPTEISVTVNAENKITPGFAFVRGIAKYGHTRAGVLAEFKS